MENPSIETYLVYTKGDDYNACVTDLVQTTQELAKQYYAYQKIATEHVEILKKYFNIVEFEQEKERSEGRRFYGYE